MSLSRLAGLDIDVITGNATFRSLFETGFKRSVAVDAGVSTDSVNVDGYEVADSVGPSRRALLRWSARALLQEATTASGVSVSFPVKAKFKSSKILKN